MSFFSVFLFIKPESKEKSAFVYLGVSLNTDYAHCPLQKLGKPGYKQGRKKGVVDRLRGVHLSGNKCAVNVVLTK